MSADPIEIKPESFESYTTKRATIDSIDKILYQPYKVLDKGFVRVIDYMGSDQSIVQSARVSYGQGTKKLRQDQGLINYLMRHRHTTPFEMCEIKFHIKLPIFIARQWIRHRTANVNEYSARYSVLGKEFYVPQRENLCPQSELNKQGRDGSLSNEEADRVLEIIKNDSTNCYAHYEELLNQDQEGNIINDNNQGIARELARMNLTLNYYTEWYWKIDLHNLLHFLALRVDSHAQFEIREYAQTMLDIVKQWVPLAYSAFEDYRMNSFECSGKMMETLNRKLKGENITLENSGLTKREWEELTTKFAI